MTDETIITAETPEMPAPKSTCDVLPADPESQTAGSADEPSEKAVEATVDEASADAAGAEPQVDKSRLSMEMKVSIEDMGILQTIADELTDLKARITKIEGQIRHIV